MRVLAFLLLLLFINPVYAAEEVYICPMHPHIEGGAGDTCPICGMSLVPKQTEKTSASGDESGTIDENASQIPYTAQIINDKENLSKFMNIVKTNIDKHAANCTVKKDPNDRFTHKIVFVAEIDHEGQIGKFIGNRGKNIKHLTNQVIDSLGTSKVNITMVPSNTEMKRPPWMNKYIRLDTNPDNHFEVHIIVSANIPGGHHADYKKTLCALTPIISQSVLNLQKVKESSTEIMASEFLDNIAPQYLPGCTDYANDDW